MRWIALHLPSLSLETFAALRLPGDQATLRLPGDQATLRLPGDQAAPPQPLALIDAHRIIGANDAALAFGVKPGMKRATALALAPQLLLGQADPARDAQALTAAAHTALAYTPNVSIQPASGAVGTAEPHTVLLEVQSTLRYFGGLAELLRRLQADLAPLGHRLQVTTAPTALGAALLARIHPECHCPDIDSARAALDAAPVWLLGPGQLHWEALQGMGLHTLSDLRRLPRTGIARRFGEAVLDEFDRAFGHRPDLREPLVLPPVFESRLELFARADSTEQVLHGAAILLTRLVAWLSAQHAQARRFTLVMAHEPRWRASLTPAATPLEIALAEPSRDAAHLLALLKERLARIELPAPTLELRLHCDAIARRPPPNLELFSTPRNEQEGLTRLIERLQARLGPEQVQRIGAVQDHRPERATEVVMADASHDCSSRTPPRGGGRAATAQAKLLVGAGRVGGRSAVADGDFGAGLAGGVRAAGAGAGTGTGADRATDALSPRPVWLFAEPEPLAGQGSTPIWAGVPLQLLSGPERIESGWWDSELAARDYYIAQKPDGMLLWVFRSRLLLSAPSQGWFCQGAFG